jgi:hypothetical protein
MPVMSSGNTCVQGTVCCMPYTQKYFNSLDNISVLKIHVAMQFRIVCDDIQRILNIQLRFLVIIYGWRYIVFFVPECSDTCRILTLALRK